MAQSNDDEDFNAAIAGLEDVRRFEAGAREGFVVHAPASVDTKKKGGHLQKPLA